MAARDDGRGRGTGPQAAAPSPSLTFRVPSSELAVVVGRAAAGGARAAGAGDVAARLVGGLGFGDAALQLGARLLRGRAPRLHRAAHLLPLDLDRLPGVLDAPLHLVAGLTEPVAHRLRHVVGEVLRARPRALCPAREASARLLTGLGGEEKGHARADREADQEGTDPALVLLDHHEGLVVVELVLAHWDSSGPGSCWWRYRFLGLAGVGLGAGRAF